MVRTITQYECGICGSKYNHERFAENCEERGMLGLFDGLEVGAIVQTSKRWAWHVVENSPWTSFGPAETPFEQRIKSAKVWYSPYYVVTAVNVASREHWARYHLACPVWVTGKKIVLWTEPGHAAPKRVYDAPEEVKKWAESALFENCFRGKLGNKYV